MYHKNWKVTETKFKQINSRNFFIIFFFNLPLKIIRKKNIFVKKNKQTNKIKIIYKYCIYKEKDIKEKQINICKPSYTHSYTHHKEKFKFHAVFIYVFLCSFSIIIMFPYL